MREIKFRAWDKVYKHFHEGDLIREYVIGEFIDNPEYEVSQYTGLKDKNGKEIYEGDILKFGYVITYVDGSDKSNLGMDIGFYCQRDNFESWAMLEIGEEYEVIGNIYENPELLGKNNG